MREQNIVDNEIGKYKKKKNGGSSKSKAKSKHKHAYSEYLLMEGGRPHLALCCNVCGKIYNVMMCETKRLESGCYAALTDAEIFEKHADLPRAEVLTIFQKYISVDDISEREEAE